MMKVRNFQVLSHKEPDPFFLEKELFTPRDDLKGWRKWVSDRCFRLLRKFGCYADKPMHVVTHRTPIDDSRGVLSDRLQNLIHPRGLWAGEAKSILMGPELYDEIMGGSGMSEGWVSMNHEMRAGLGRNVQVFCLDVHVIPQMEGVLVLPGRIDADGRYSTEEMAHQGVLQGNPQIYEQVLMDQDSRTSRRRDWPN